MLKPIGIGNAGIYARKRRNGRDPATGRIEQAGMKPLSQQNRGTAQADVVGEGKLPDGQVMATVNCLVMNENG